MTANIFYFLAKCCKRILSELLNCGFYSELLENDFGDLRGFGDYFQIRRVFEIFVCFFFVGVIDKLRPYEFIYLHRSNISDYNTSPITFCIL